VQAAAKAAWDTPSTATAATATQPAAMWLGEDEVRESGFVDLEDAPVTDAASPEAAETSTDTAEPSARGSELAMGSWVELRIKGQWLRAQLTWSSPHGTLFMFTSQAGTAHSMSRRTLEKLHAAGEIRLVADRNVLDEALDQVAQAALKNSLNSP